MKKNYEIIIVAENDIFSPCEGKCITVQYLNASRGEAFNKAETIVAKLKKSYANAYIAGVNEWSNCSKYM